MSLYNQQAGINAARNTIDDQYQAKSVFRFNPLQGLQDGTNKIFQIPQTRIVNNVLQAPIPIIYKDGSALGTPADWAFIDPVASSLQFATAPDTDSELSASFYYTWFTDVEWDRHLNRAANNLGFTRYFTLNSDGTAPSLISGTEALPGNGIYPSDIDDGLWAPLTVLAGAHAARALAFRYSTRYDTSAGDQSFSPSQMAVALEKIADSLFKQAAADIAFFYDAQGRAANPAVGTAGLCLPAWTPKR